MEFIRNTARRQCRSARGHVLALAAALALTAPLSASAQAIRMAWTALPPHIFAQEGAEGGGPPTGPTIALFESIAARMGYRVDWVGPLPLSRITSERETGDLKLDGATMSIMTPDWLKQQLYPSRPYFSAVPCIAVRSDNPLHKVDSIADIDGYRIGWATTLASIYPPIIADHKDRLVLDELGGEDWIARNLQKLAVGRLDAVFELNRYSLAYAAAMEGLADKVRILLLPGDPLNHYFVFNRNSPRAQALLDAYERAVAGMKFDYGAMLDAEIARRAGSAGGSKGR
jgi:ABC-type amino acid transport substrate-binding protein